MNMKELCAALNISQVMAYRLKAKGMPCDSVEAAMQWRDKHLDPSKRKEYREDGNPGVRLEQRPGINRSAGGTVPSIDPLATVRANPKIAEIVEDHERLVGGFLFPAIFSLGSPFTSLLINHLISECALNEAQALRVYQVAAMGFVAASNAFFGDTDARDGTGISFELPDLLAKIAMHGTGEIGIAAYFANLSKTDPAVEDNGAEL
ncbi:MAG: hypothetical protein HYU74_13220 [Dechloromonas sp.]|nr:hypothetical protein [Dechloromonas sp.]